MNISRAVFDLRKNGEFAKAFTLARKVFEKQPMAVSNVQTYGWCLVEAIKQAENAGNRSKCLELVVEFSRLQVPERVLNLYNRQTHYQVKFLCSDANTDKPYKPRQAITIAKIVKYVII